MRLVYGLLIALSVMVVAPFAASAQQAPAATPQPAYAESPPPIPSPSPGPEDPKISKLAVVQFLAWQSGAVNRALYTDQVNDQMSEDVLTRGTATLARLGALQKATFRGIAHAQGNVNFYVYDMACERGAIKMSFAMDPAGTGKIALIFFE